VNYQALQDQLILDEGIRLHAYTDTVGKLTIGVGRNLDDIGISKQEALTLLQNDVTHVVNALDGAFPWWRGMSDIRQQVLANMCFNMGIVRLSGFKNALAAMERGDYETAANEMHDSSWSNQVGDRAVRLVSLMRNGQ
jgi:lysozyme